MQYMKNRAKNHIVTHELAGNNRHIFTVKDDLFEKLNGWVIANANESFVPVDYSDMKERILKLIGEDHTVIITVSCDCDFMSHKGIANNLSCSHILAVAKKIWEDGKINPVFWMNSTAKTQSIRNAVIGLVKPMNRKINEIRGSEGGKHFDKKTELCKQLIEQEKQFITEAEFTTGGIADILVLDDAKIIEIVNTESLESLADKWNKYPKGLKLEIVRV